MPRLMWMWFGWLGSGLECCAILNLGLDAEYSTGSEARKAGREWRDGERGR